MNLPSLDAVSKIAKRQTNHAHSQGGPGPHERRAPTRHEDASERLEKLSRGVLVSTFVAVAAVGFGIVSATSAQMQVDKVTGNMKPVAVAVQTIEAGAVITENQVSTAMVPQSYLSGDTALDAASYIGKTASVTIPANSQMSPCLVADLGNTSSLAAKIPTGFRAVTVNVTSSSGLSTLLRCGDRVQVYASTRDRALYRVASNVTVLALDGSLSGPTNGAAYSTVTLQVNDGEAEAIGAAEQEGSIILVLNPTSERS